MKRNTQIDRIKGFLILLVIYGHVIQIILTALNYNFYDDVFEKIICSFHMPSFAMLSGCLL